MFGYDYPDKQLLKVERGQKLFTSELLDKDWQNQGFSTIGSVTFQSAAYVARYIMKKQNGEEAEKKYARINFYTGELEGVRPEYTTMSRNPGIASGWFEKYGNELFPDDFVVLDNKKYKVPKYYLGMYEINDPEGYELIRKNRKEQARQDSANNTPERLEQRAQYKEYQVEQLKRQLQ